MIAHRFVLIIDALKVSRKGIFVNRLIFLGHYVKYCRDSKTDKSEKGVAYVQVSEPRISSQDQGKENADLRNDRSLSSPNSSCGK